MPLPSSGFKRKPGGMFLLWIHHSCENLKSYAENKEFVEVQKFTYFKEIYYTRFKQVGQFIK
jgi:hypothetical protein